MPGTAVYCVKPSLIALIASSLIRCGVPKSGSPAEKERISFPCAFKSRASEEIAIVMTEIVFVYGLKACKNL